MTHLLMITSAMLELCYVQKQLSRLWPKTSSYCAYGIDDSLQFDMNRNVKKTSNVYMNVNEVNYRRNAIQMGHYCHTFFSLSKVSTEIDAWTSLDNTYA